MSRKHQELESRLDDMITRIHKETQEIKELEQQLTDGQQLLLNVVFKLNKINIAFDHYKRMNMMF